MGAAQSVDAATSGDGTIKNVGIRVSASYQCPQCCQKFGDKRTLDLHCSFIHTDHSLDCHRGATTAQVDEEDEEVMCRYCFGGEEDGELISPCACIGSQKYAHLSCLRQWQKMVLVSHPTDPSMQKKDSRHHICNVCNSQYTCPPPTRHDLMVSYTGAEIAELINEGSIIGAQDVFVNGLTQKMERQFQQQFPNMTAERISQEINQILFRFRGAYLVHNVEQEPGVHEVHITNQLMLNGFRESLNDGLSLSVAGKELRVVAAGSLAGVAEEDLREKLAALHAPVSLNLALKETPTHADDRVAAVDLTQRIEPFSGAQVDQAMNRACEKYYGARCVKLTHYLGGPVDAHKISICLVPGGEGRGWTLEKDLSKAIELAHSRAVKRHKAQGKIGGGQTIQLTGLQGAAHLNGALGIALRFIEGSGRWSVRLTNGEVKQVKMENLVAKEGGKGRVYVFWGTTCWSRTQLLGEVARGQWGLGRASVQDIALPEKQRKKGLDGRLAYAPVSEMTEDFIRDASKADDANP